MGLTPQDADRLKARIYTLFAKAAERDAATADLPMLLKPWRVHPRFPDVMWRIANGNPPEGFRRMTVIGARRTFLVNPSGWWSNGGGGGPETGEAGQRAADALALSRGYVLDNGDDTYTRPSFALDIARGRR